MATCNFASDCLEASRDTGYYFKFKVYDGDYLILTTQDINEYNEKNTGPLKFKVECYQNNINGGDFIGKLEYYTESNLFIFCNFIIEEKFRRKGYGTLLVETVNKIADTYYPSLEKVVHCNDQSINIFKKLGFNEKEKYTILTK